MYCTPDYSEYYIGDSESDNPLSLNFSEELLNKSFRCHRQRTVLLDTLAVTKRRVKVDGELIRIISEKQLDAVRKVLVCALVSG
jgi:hypothetical protein